MGKLDAELLRKVLSPRGSAGRKNDIYILVDNVLDTYNIGSIIRPADTVGARKVCLCGETATPPDPKIRRASINTVQWVDWEYRPSAVEAILALRGEAPGVQVVALEQTPGSVRWGAFSYRLPIALVVGHESYGVSPEALAAADAVVEIPLFGVNVSLNVIVALGIVLYKVVERMLAEAEKDKAA